MFGPLTPWVPHAAIAIGLLALIVWIRFTWPRGLARRPVLLIGLLLSAVAPLYMGLVWTNVLPESYVRFGRPWATLIGPFVMAFVALRLASYGSRQGRWRAVLSDALSTLAVLACAWVVASPELGRPLDRLTIITVVDRSRSIDLVPNADQRIKLELTTAETSMRDEDLIGTVVFGSTAAAQQPPRAKSKLAAPQVVDIGRDGTDIGAAIRRALAELPADSAARLVILSDGVATRGDALAAAAAAATSDIPIDVVPLEQQEMPDVRIVSFRTAARAREKESLDMRLVVKSPERTKIEVRLKRNGELVSRAVAEVAQGEDVLRIRQPATTSGLHRYDVEISALDPRLDGTAEDNLASSFVRVAGPARALVLDGDPGKTRFVASALEGAGFHVAQGSFSSVPADVGAMAGFDVIVMGDIAAKDLSPDQLEALAS